MNAIYIPESHLRLVENADGAITISLSKYITPRIGKAEFAECQTKPGDELSPGVPFVTIETNKSVYEVALPFQATLAEFNPLVREDASLICSQPEGDGWICRVRPTKDTWREGTLDETAYAAYIAP